MAAVTLPRLITRAEVVAALTYTELLPAVERALATFARRNDKEEETMGRGGVFPDRMLMNIQEKEGHVFFMPVYSAVDDIIATKIVAVYPKNGERYNISSHLSTIMLHDASNGVLKAVVDGEEITGMRTAAASAIATKYLAKTGSKILTVMGAGVQADAHISALKHVMTPTEVRVWARSFEKAQVLAKKHGARACSMAQEAVTDADVLVTCTGATSPILEAAWLKPGIHINAVGACVPWAMELGTEAMKMGVVYCDTIPGALKESGDIIQSKVEIFGEIGEVINGTKEAKKEETTIFKSQGLALEDAVAGRLVYDKVTATSTE